MKYNIQKAIDYILDEHRPASLRAIKLFTLLVAIHAVKNGRGVTDQKLKAISGEPNNSSIALENDDGHGLILSVPKTLLRRARLLAAMKFLDQIEKDWKANNPGQRLRLKEVAQIPEYRRIYNNVILKHGGWQKIRFLPGVRKLEEDIEVWQKQARDVARVIAFSTSFEPNPLKPKIKGGVTMSIDIVTGESGAKYFGSRRGKTQVEAAWSRLKNVAPFHFLLYQQKYAYFLKGVAGKGFSTKWLGRVERRKDLLEFFATYNAVVERLKLRNYRYALLELPPDAPPSKIEFTPIRPTTALSKGVLSQIDRYRR